MIGHIHTLTLHTLYALLTTVWYTHSSTHTLQIHYIIGLTSTVSTHHIDIIELSFTLLYYYPLISIHH